MIKISMLRHDEKDELKSLQATQRLLQHLEAIKNFKYCAS